MVGTNPSHLFVAVPIPEEIRTVLSAWMSEWREQWPFRKWVYPDDYHITLQFLGSCSPPQVEAVKQQLAQAVFPTKPFTLSLDRLDCFGQRHKPRILWAGVSGDVPGLHILQQHVADALEPIGFPRESRPYRPHITLAKHYRRNDFPADLLSSFRFLSEKPLAWEVKEFALYQTHLGQIPMYEALKQYRVK